MAKLVLPYATPQPTPPKKKRPWYVLVLEIAVVVVFLGKVGLGVYKNVLDDRLKKATEERARRDTLLAEGEKVKKTAEGYLAELRETGVQKNSSQGNAEMLAHIEKQLRDLRAAVGKESEDHPSASIRLMSHLGRVGAGFQKNIDRLERERVLDFTSLRDLETLEARRKILREVMASNLALQKEFHDAPALMERFLQEDHLPPDEAVTSLRDFNERMKGKIVGLDRIRNLEREVGERWLKIFDLAEAEWGNWIVGTALKFSASEANDKLQALVDEIEQKTAEGDSARKDYKALFR